jgi:RNA polymerase sigma-70 factor, ECF subfamily
VTNPAIDLRGRQHRRPLGFRTSVQSAQPGVCRQGVRLQFTAFDAPYLERLQRGDAGTERHFSIYFGELIQLKLRSRLNSREALEDIRQETFARVLALVREKDGVRQPERLGALVNSICNNVLLEHYRAHGKSNATLDDQPEQALVDERVSGADLVEVNQREQVVKDILRELPERDRRLLQAVLLEERDKDEVCAELGLSREYLRVLVHRAKQAFKGYYLRRIGTPDPRECLP